MISSAVRVRSDPIYTHMVHGDSNPSDREVIVIDGLRVPRRATASGVAARLQLFQPE
jgi:hypothetical protein